ncbi:MAG: cupin domain-containing protein [Thermogemmatispora sp.]|uniref:cupin domain-containing protein n=1 Tax=Thermogemmatispora sp. TaxID=1968838 RepID=UPI0026116D37|nr:cupin domain-containing protein [Thermogemmatispora sp.]MBX5456618.1 cupin domain-containing protein [Thermogemmatispora sp.]
MTTAGRGLIEEQSQAAKDTSASVTEAEERLRLIGSLIRARRRELKLSLRELSKRTGLSIGFLSLVERGRSSLALTSLSTVAKALDMNLASFFPPAEQEKGRPGMTQLPYVQRAENGSQLAVVSSLRTYKMLSPRAPNLTLEPLYVTIQPGDVKEEPYSHDGEEFAYILEGELVFIIAGQQYCLGPGDSIYFHSSVPHAIRNETGAVVRAIWVLTPRLM